MLWQAGGGVTIEMEHDSLPVDAATLPSGCCCGDLDPVSRRGRRTLVRRLAPRLIADILAASLGLAVFAISTGVMPRFQILFAVGYVVFAALMDVTHVRREWNHVEEFTVALKTAAAALLLVSVASFLLSHPLSRILFGSVAVAMIALRPVAAAVIDRFSASVVHARRILVVCGDDEYQLLTQALSGVRGPRVAVRRLPEGSQGRFDRVVEVCASFQPAKMVVGERQLRDEAFVSEVAKVNEWGVPIRSFPQVFEEDFGRVRISNLDDSWFLFDIGPLHRLGYRLARRVVDVLVGVLVVAVLVPLAPLVALAIKIDSRGPVFFVQPRVGQRGRTFHIYKLRTMQADAEPDGPVFAQLRDKRVTRVGRVLRRCRVDELPQAFNLLKGDMSLIGPRPERPEFVQMFAASIPFYTKRHLIKPGITGWAQVHEGYGSSLEDTVRKLERDLYYLRHQSLGVDLRVLMATVASVLRFAGR